MLQQLLLLRLRRAGQGMPEVERALQSIAPLGGVAAAASALEGSAVRTGARSAAGCCPAVRPQQLAEEAAAPRTCAIWLRHWHGHASQCIHRSC